MVTPRWLRKLSHSKIRKAAQRGNPLAKKILKEMSKDAGKKTTKALKKARKAERKKRT